MILELKDSVTTLETSKRLKELGVRQDSQFYWIEFHQGYAKGHRDYDKNGRWEIRNKDSAVCFKEKYSAYTAGELGVLLPIEILNTYDMKIYRDIYFRDNKMVWVILYEEEDRDGDKNAHKEITHTNEAEARGKMLIYLLENKIISVKEINKQ